MASTLADRIKLVCEIHKGNGYCGAASVMLGEEPLSKSVCIVKVVNLDADARQTFHLSEDLMSKITHSRALSPCAASSNIESPFSPKRDLCSMACHELTILRSLKHPNVICLFDTCMVSNYLYLYFDLYEFGSVRDVLDSLNFRQSNSKPNTSSSNALPSNPNDVGHETRGLSEFAIAYIISCVLRALQYLHSTGIIHRAVRPAHILLGSPRRVTLSGFELAIRTTPVHTNSTSSNAESDNQALADIQSKRCFDFTSGFADNLAYVAPECLAQDQRGYDSLADIYSVGITAAEMYNGVTPFGIDFEPLNILAAKARNETPRLQVAKNEKSQEDEDQPDLQSFVDLCCAPFEGRPSADALFESDWLKQFCGHDADEIEAKLASLGDIFCGWLADCAQPIARRARSRDAAMRLNAAGVNFGADTGSNSTSVVPDLSSVQASAIGNSLASGSSSEWLFA